MPGEWSIEGKVCVITGASSGIGRQAAFELAKRKARVVLVCRSPERAERARDEIVKESLNPHVDVVLADLFEQREVRRAAAEVDDRYGQLHVLINNAGLLIGKRRLTGDGIESTFALNHLAYFLLTRLLLEKIKASAPARIINTSSMAHGMAKWQWDNLQGERRYSQWRAYGNSKLANLYFTYELARRLTGTGVTANAVHPGFVRSNFGRSASPAMRAGLAVARPFAIGVAQGALTTVWAATEPGLSKVTGKYFARSHAVSSSAMSYDQQAQARLWALSEQLTGTAPA
jgi:NAD(P)-dependent dehydrogenase (short-subunit alcohol dehydrogenase family)